MMAVLHPLQHTHLCRISQRARRDREHDLTRGTQRHTQTGFFISQTSKKPASAKRRPNSARNSLSLSSHTPIPPAPILASSPSKLSYTLLFEHIISNPVTKVFERLRKWRFCSSRGWLYSVRCHPIFSLSLFAKMAKYAMTRTDLNNSRFSLCASHLPMVISSSVLYSSTPTWTPGFERHYRLLRSLVANGAGAEPRLDLRTPKNEPIRGQLRRRGIVGEEWRRRGRRTG